MATPGRSGSGMAWSRRVFQRRGKSGAVLRICENMYVRLCTAPACPPEARRTGLPGPHGRRPRRRLWAIGFREAEFSLGFMGLGVHRVLSIAFLGSVRFRVSRAVAKSQIPRPPEIWTPHAGADAGQ